MSSNIYFSRGTLDEEDNWKDKMDSCLFERNHEQEKRKRSFKKLTSLK